MKLSRLLFFLLFPLFLATTAPAHSQILGIFQQGAQELKEYGQQIAALELLLTRQQTGYQILKSGIASVSSITNNEFNLHQSYISSLSAVNPSITQMPQVIEILSLQSSMLQHLTQAETRWHDSPTLTPSDLAYVQCMASVLTNAASNIVTTLTQTLSSNFSMTDNDRIIAFSQLGSKTKSLFAFCAEFTGDVDLLIMSRK